MNVLYNLALFLYWLMVSGLSPFNEKARLFTKGRKNWQQSLSEKIEQGQEYIWFHCASLGEFEQGRPVIEEIKKQFPEYKILLTFFSPSGYEIRKNYPLADHVCYLPLDTRKNAHLFFEIVNPAKVFLIKYEFWHNFLSEAKKRDIPLYVISAIFRSNQIFFRNNFIGRWFLKSLTGITLFFVQDNNSVNLMNSVGFNNVFISGDTRFDRVVAIAGNAKQIPLVEEFKKGNRLLIIGSSWQPDEDLIIRYINQSEGIKFIIAPHEVSASNLSRIKKDLKKPVTFFSSASESEISGLDVLIIDSIGILSSLYQYGDVAYIGGGFGVGIHNILEAATFGLPVIFGPNYKKFKEANDLVNLNLAFPVSDYKQLEQKMEILFSSQNDLFKLSGLIKEYIRQHTGATQIVINNTFE